MWHDKFESARLQRSPCKLACYSGQWSAPPSWSPFYRRLYGCLEFVDRNLYRATGPTSRLRRIRCGACSNDKFVPVGNVVKDLPDLHPKCNKWLWSKTIVDLWTEFTADVAHCFQSLISLSVSFQRALKRCDWSYLWRAHVQGLGYVFLYSPKVPTSFEGLEHFHYQRTLVTDRCTFCVCVLLIWNIFIAIADAAGDHFPAQERYHSV